MRRLAIFVLMAIGLAACAAEPVWAPDDEVARAHYVSSEAPSITLFTVINRKSGNGGHSSLLVNAPSERLLFDPAGTFHHPRLPERNDVVFGMSDPAVVFYIDYHTRITWRTVEQKIPVSAEVAEMAKQLILENGAVPKAYCASSVSAILRQLPGFEGVKSTMFPENLMEELAGYAGVQTREYVDDDPDNNGYILAHGI